MTNLADARVADFMTRSVVSVDKNEELIEAIGLMDSKCLSVLPVVDEVGKVCGILSNSDLIAMTYELQCDVSVLPHVSQCVRDTLIDALSEDKQSAKVTTAMTCDVETISEQATIPEAALKMLECDVHHLPVVDELKKPLGIIATTDIVRAVAEASKKT